MSSSRSIKWPSARSIFSEAAGKHYFVAHGEHQFRLLQLLQQSAPQRRGIIEFTPQFLALEAERLAGLACLKNARPGGIVAGPIMAHMDEVLRLQGRYLARCSQLLQNVSSRVGG